MKKLLPILLLCLAACSHKEIEIFDIPEGNSYARLFQIEKLGNGDRSIISISPFSGARDSLVIHGRVERLVCMSSTYVAGFDAVDADSLVCGVSGLRYISSEKLRSLGNRVAEVGYDEMPDYEKIISIHPDLVLACQTGPAVPTYVNRLRELGVRVLVVYDNYEDHPLARAEYLRMQACLAGKLERADSIFSEVCGRYERTAELLRDAPKKKVLMNKPYADQWFIPGKDSYMARFIQDAGGELLGSREGRESAVISIERAFTLARTADFWLHPGTDRTLAALKSEHPLFPSFPVIDKPHAVWNNVLRCTEAGGNDFWESGAIRPDLVLCDLAAIMHPELADSILSETDASADSDTGNWKSTYYLEIE